MSSDEQKQGMADGVELAFTRIFGILPMTMIEARALLEIRENLRGELAGTRWPDTLEVRQALPLVDGHVSFRAPLEPPVVDWVDLRPMPEELRFESLLQAEQARLYSSAGSADLLPKAEPPPTTPEDVRARILRVMLPNGEHTPLEWSGPFVLADDDGFAELVVEPPPTTPEDVRARILQVIPGDVELGDVLVSDEGVCTVSWRLPNVHAYVEDCTCPPCTCRRNGWPLPPVPILPVRGRNSINRAAFNQLVREDLAALEASGMPRLERLHIALILRESVGVYYPAEHMPLFEVIRAVGHAMAFDSRDWARDRRDAWLYAIFVGWDDEALDEVGKRHRWTQHELWRLGLARAAVVRLLQVREEAGK